MSERSNGDGSGGGGNERQMCTVTEGGFDRDDGDGDDDDDDVSGGGGSGGFCFRCCFCESKAAACTRALNTVLLSFVGQLVPSESVVVDSASGADDVSVFAVSLALY